MLNFGASQFIGGAAPGYALFGGGATSALPYGSATTCFYAYVANIVTRGNNLSIAYNQAGACAGRNYGIYSGQYNPVGITAQGTATFTFSTKAMGTGTAVGWSYTYTPSYASTSGLGNAVKGYILHNGIPSESHYANISAYTYATAAVAQANNGNINGVAPGCGNSAFGIFAAGETNSGPFQFTLNYSTAAVAKASVQFPAGTAGAAAGNSNVGIFSKGSSTVVNTWSTNSVAVGTSLTASVSSGSAAGNAALGVFGGTTATTSIYNYANNATTSGTNLAYSATGLAAITSSNPGVI